MTIHAKTVFATNIIALSFLFTENAHASSAGGLEFPCKDSALAIPYLKTKGTLRVDGELCEVIETKPKKPLFWFTTARLNSINGASIGAGITDLNDYTQGPASVISIGPAGAKLDVGYIYHSGFDDPKPFDYSHYFFPAIAGSVKASIVQRWSIPTTNHPVIFGRGSEYTYFGYSATIHFLYATFELGQYHPFSEGSRQLVASYGIGF